MIHSCLQPTSQPTSHIMGPLSFPYSGIVCILQDVLPSKYYKSNFSQHLHFIFLNQTLNIIHDSSPPQSSFSYSSTHHITKYEFSFDVPQHDGEAGSLPSRCQADARSGHPNQLCETASADGARLIRPSETHDRTGKDSCNIEGSLRLCQLP